MTSVLWTEVVLWVQLGVNDGRGRGPPRGFDAPLAVNNPFVKVSNDLGAVVIQRADPILDGLKGFHTTLSDVAICVPLSLLP